jgi:hypothetical protein
MNSRYLGVLGAVVALVSTASLAQLGPAPDVALAQLPPPFGAPGPLVPKSQSCSPQYQRLLKLQIEGMRQLQRLSRSEGEMLCSALESADTLGIDKFVDPKALQRFLTPEQRELVEAFGVDLSKIDIARIMRLLGVDLSRVDLRQFKHQCRQSQGEIGRFATNELGRLENEMIRCDDRI